MRPIQKPTTPAAPRRHGRSRARIGCLLAAVAVWTATGADPFRESESSAAFRIQSVTADTKPIALQPDTRLTLPAEPKQVVFAFGPGTNLATAPLRIRYKLDGHDETWREPAGEMRLLIRFFGGDGDQVGENVFSATGHSEGWTGRLEGSRFLRHRASVTVPERATAFWVVLSSAGPPNSVGVFWLTNLVVSKMDRTTKTSEVVIPWAFAPMDAPDSAESAPVGWMRDGLRPSMAKTATFGSAPVLGIEDDDVNGHAEWHTLKDTAPTVSQGDVLTIEWADAYSIGLAGSAAAIYPELPAGFFRFRLNELSLSGMPLPTEASLSLEVPLAAWKTPWFWIAVATGLTAVGIGGWRLAEWRRIQSRLGRLEQHRAIEQERLRIAQDIHDDLGARVTQISLFSAVAQKRDTLPAEARADFGEVSRLARNLVSALYETVWSVNPENDSLDALANYLCQVGNQLCSEAQLRCRLEVPSLPPSIPLTSQVRHNLIMAVKEAVHNVIKHASASEVRIGIAFAQPMLAVTIQDDGCGFDPEKHVPGNGLGNLRRRMESIGGEFHLESEPGRGTRIRLILAVPETTGNSR